MGRGGAENETLDLVVWILLAMPVIWMSWAMILYYLSAILSFVWRTGSVSDPSDRPPLGDRAALGPRIVITCVLALGLGYMAMIIMPPASAELCYRNEPVFLISPKKPWPNEST